MDEDESDNWKDEKGVVAGAAVGCLMGGGAWFAITPIFWMPYHGDGPIDWLFPIFCLGGAIAGYFIAVMRIEEE